MESHPYKKGVGRQGYTGAMLQLVPRQWVLTSEGTMLLVDRKETFGRSETARKRKKRKCKH